MKNFFLKALIVLSALFTIAGCNAIVREEQPSFEGLFFVLSNRQSIGQTFLSRNAGLQGVEAYIRPAGKANGSVKLTLYADSSATQTLATAALPLENIQDGGYYRFSFETPLVSDLKDYYLEFELVGSGAVELGGTPEERYIEGSAYQNRVPAGGQLTFKLAYDPGRYALGLARQGLAWVFQFGLGLLLFILPGWVLLSLLLPSWKDVHFEERFCLSAGVSAAYFPILLLLTHAVGIQLGPWYAWGTLLVCGVLIGAGWLRSRRQPLAGLAKPVKISLPRIAFWGVALLVFAIRFWVVRVLAIPLGLDSIQHVAIVQLIQGNLGLFSSWLPYAPYDSFSVHFGFHSLAAVYGWAGGLDSLQTVIVSGQILNGLAVLTLYPLATWVSRGNRWAGVACVLVVGLLSPMPAYYTNYGRYPQLIGELILPVVIWLTLTYLESPSLRPRRALIAAIALAGMFFCYYRMVYLYGTFILAWLIVVELAKWRLSLRAWGEAILKLGLVGLFSLGLIAPWLPVLFSNRLGSEDIEGRISTWAQAFTDYRIYANIQFYIPAALLAVVVLSLLLALVQRKKEMLAFVLWSGFMSGFVLTAPLHFPGASMMPNVVWLLSVYIPVGVLVGWLAGEITDWLGQRTTRVHWGVMFAGIALIGGVWGAYHQRTLINIPRQSFATRPDLRAMAWIRENLPADARIMIRGQRFKVSSVIAGDGGAYISLLAGRESSVPPQYALVMEHPYQEGYNAEVINQVFQLEEVKITSPTGINMLCENRYSYVYLGQKTVAADPGALKSFYTFDDLSASQDFEPVYHQDGVSIFKLKQDRCPNH